MEKNVSSVAEQDKTAEVKKNPKLIELARPYKFDDKEYTEIDLSGLDDLTIKDAVLIIKKLYNEGEMAVMITPETATAYTDALAAAATKLPIEFFQLLPIGASKKVRQTVQASLRSAAAEEDGDEDEHSHIMKFGKVPSTKVNGDFEIELSALLAVSNKANISITVDPQMQALAKLVKAEIEKHNADASAHAATITAAVSAAVKNLSESGEILNEEQVKALIKEQVDGGTGGGYYGSYKLTLAADGWKPARSEDDYENAGGMDYYQCIYDAELSDSTSELVPVGVVSPGSFYTTTKAGVLNGCETHDGFIRFFAQRIPEADIQATVTLFGKGGGSGETGSVSIGQGLKRDASGAIAVRIGEGLDFDSANALTVRKETVMTSEDLLDEEETQQEIVDMLK